MRPARRFDRFTKSCAREIASRGRDRERHRAGLHPERDDGQAVAGAEDAITRRIPLATLGTADDVAHAVWFFRAAGLALHHRPGLAGGWRDWSCRAQCLDRNLAIDPGKKNADSPSE